MSRISFEPTEDVRQNELHRDSSTSSVNQCNYASPAEEQRHQAWLEQHPCLLQHFEEFEAAAAGKRVAVFLDYDGTLTPIVNNPDSAFLSEHMREAVRCVAGIFPTAIISGRGREKVEQFVQLRELFYAGSHGMDICGPRAAAALPSNPKALPSNPPADGNPTSAAHAADCAQPAAAAAAAGEIQPFQPAAHFEPLMQQINEELWAAVRHIPGASIENNKFCVSVHFRNCEPAAYEVVLAEVEAVISQHECLHITRGRKVLEVRPKLEWNKGSALLHLLRMLGLDQRDVYCLYIGDDRTDEDAFQVLAQTNAGAGILVSSRAKDTAGKWTLKDPAEVAAFLYRLVAWGRTASNLWHQHRSCTGWALTAPEAGAANGQQQDAAAAMAALGGGFSADGWAPGQSAASKLGCVGAGQNGQPHLLGLPPRPPCGR